MNKFKVGQRIFSQKFGEGVVKKIDSDGDLCIEFDKEDEKLHCCFGHVKYGFGAFYKHNGNSGFYNDAITPIGPYEGERVLHDVYGEGTIVETDSGFGKVYILVQYDVCFDDLHDGNEYTNNGRYANHTCWYYLKRDYGTEIKPINAAQKPELSEIERVMQAHVEKYHSEPAAPTEPLIPEGFTLVDAQKPPAMYDVELILKDGSRRYGFLNSNITKYVIFWTDAKPVGAGSNCVSNTNLTRRTVIESTEVLAWRHIAASEPIIPEGWNAGLPDNNDNVEIMLDNGDTSVGYYSRLSRKWLEFDKKEHAKALEDKHFDSVHAHECKRDVIAWRVPQPKPEQKQFKRGDRVVTPQGYHGTFVAYTDSKKAIFMLDECQGKGWRADFEPGRYGEFLYVDPEELKPES